jgi:hypothetical protein
LLRQRRSSPPFVALSRLSTPNHTSALVALMMAQALLGLLWPSAYRDPDWIRATWLANDCITLLIAAPLLWVSGREASASTRAELVSLGTVGYSVYNYAFYLFGAALNAFLPLYVITLGVAIVTLTSGLVRVDPIAVHRQMRTAVHARLLGGYLIFVASGLSVAWTATWAAYTFGGRPTPIDPEAFKIVAALDLLWLVPTLAAGGTLLWKQRPWGFVLGTAAAVQGALYLLVLSVNSTLAIRRGFTAFPGELPIWVPLMGLTWTAALLLLKDANRGDAGRR